MLHQLSITSNIKIGERMNTHVQKIKMLHKNFTFWLKKNWYYHMLMARFYKFMVPPGNTVLQISCKTGNILNAVKPSYGVGIDDDAECIDTATKQYPHLQFIKTEIEQLEPQQFDYIILLLTTMETYDIQSLFETLHIFCHTSTKIIIDSYACSWEPILWITQKLGLRRATKLTNWISNKDLSNFLHLADFQTITSGKHILFPCYIPVLSWFINHCLAPLPLLNRLCVNQWIVARPITQKKAVQDFSVSVIIPCKNEHGNIHAAITRTPTMGKHTQYIFIDGHSKDNTLEAMKRVQADYPEKDILVLVQEGKGKGDAVRKGFAHATGDILIILDGDLTTPPEEMPKFVKALVEGKGEFINGSRLVYGMEDEAMRFLNLLANHSFAVLFSWLLGQPIKDTLCGTKVLFKKDYEKIAANRAFFGDFDPFGDFDLIFGAAKQHLKIIDMPVHYKNRTYGSTQISRFYHGTILAYMSWIAFKKFKLHQSN